MLKICSRQLVFTTLPKMSNVIKIPSKQFINRYIRRPSQKERFIQISSELQIYYDIYGESIDELNDEMWKILLNMFNWEERCNYLLELRNSKQMQLDVEKNNKVENNLPISEINQQRYDRGEMVYARNFHTLFDLYGKDFRRLIDVMYGMNMINQMANNPSLIIDCRFLREYSVITQSKYLKEMQTLHDDNWISRNPLNIQFANYLPDQQLASISKKRLLFRFGPPTIENFKPHPFSPTLTTRKINQLIPNENLMYISAKATRFLPEKIPENIKGVVFCLSNESSPSTSSTSACIIDKVQPYRIPFKKYLRSDTRPGSIKLYTIGRIFRDYFNGTTIEKALLNNATSLRNRSTKTIVIKDEEFRTALSQINNCPM